MTIEPLLLLLVIGLALVIARMRDLFAAAMLFGMFSLLSAALYTLMDAVDVAFTEAAVGAGISTVLILGALALTGSEERQDRGSSLAKLVVALTGAALLYGALDMAPYGDPTAPIHAYIAPNYVVGTPENMHLPNIVTAVLASYRGYDTYGETTVVFTAAVGVMLLLGGRRRGKLPEEDEQ